MRYKSLHTERSAYFEATNGYNGTLIVRYVIIYINMGDLYGEVWSYARDRLHGF